MNMPETGTSVSLTGDGTTVAVGGGRGGIVEVYKENDKRASIKKEINLKYNSDLVEEKFYNKY